MDKLQVVYKRVEDLIPYINNARTHSDEQVSQIAASIKEFGFNNPILLDGSNGVIAGHGRLLAAKKLGLAEAPCIELAGLSEAQKKAYILADNRIALNSGWDNEMLKTELEFLRGGAESLDFIEKLGFSEDELGELLAEGNSNDDVVEDEPPEPPEEPKSKRGDVWLLGNHRLMCGDSTDAADVALLMNGTKADLLFTDPPYGMKKENDGVLNDNLNFSELLDFNRKWIPLSFDALTDNGSWYCWGIDVPLMDIYSSILKPMIEAKRITFRNLITWDKGSGQGQNSESTRMYAVADEKCLFVMCGGEAIQGFSVNKDDYNENMEVCRLYLVGEFEKLGISKHELVEAMGLTTITHWFSKSQFAIPTKEHYEKFREFGLSVLKRKGERDYDFLKRDYDSLKRDYDSLKRDFYAGRSYFNNVHDNMNNVWHFSRVTGNSKKEVGGHATPKPIELCERAIKSSSKEGDIVLDMFGGSGSTLIACEKQGRLAHLMELSENYCDVIIQRWQNLTNQEAIRESDGATYNSL